MMAFPVTFLFASVPLAFASASSISLSSIWTLSILLIWFESPTPYRPQWVKSWPLARSWSAHECAWKQMLQGVPAMEQRIPRKEIRFSPGQWSTRDLTSFVSSIIVRALTAAQWWKKLALRNNSTIFVSKDSCQLYWKRLMWLRNGEVRILNITIYNFFFTSLNA